MIQIENGKKYLVTGGSGFLGGELIQRILNEGGEVVTISRNEGQLIKLKQNSMTRSFTYCTNQFFIQYFLLVFLWVVFL